MPTETSDAQKPEGTHSHLADIRICKLYIKTFNNYCLISVRSLPIPEESCVYSIEDYGDYRQGYGVKTENITLGCESLGTMEGGEEFFFSFMNISYRCTI